MNLYIETVDIFDDDGNGEVDFKEFIQGLSHFSAKGDMESKLRFAFRWAELCCVTPEIKGDVVAIWLEKAIQLIFIRFKIIKKIINNFAKLLFVVQVRAR